MRLFDSVFFTPFSGGKNVSDFCNSLVFEIACLQAQLEQSQKNVTALKRRIRGLSKHLAEYRPVEPITDKENVPHD